MKPIRPQRKDRPTPVPKMFRGRNGRAVQLQLQEADWPPKIAVAMALFLTGDGPLPTWPRKSPWPPMQWTDLAFVAALDAWERSLKRPDLDERARLTGALLAYQNQLDACATGRFGDHVSGDATVVAGGTGKGGRSDG